MMRVKTALLCLVALMLGLAASPAFQPGEAAAPGATITITSLADDLTVNGDCTLREALRAAALNVVWDGCAAGAAGQPDLITFAVNGTIHLALAAGWITNLVAGGYQTPLRWTEPLVCSSGEYAFQQVTGRTLDEFGQPAASTELVVTCLADGAEREVTGQARRVLLGYWTAAYFLFFGFWAVILARRARQNAAAGAL